MPLKRVVRGSSRSSDLLSVGIWLHSMTVARDIPTLPFRGVTTRLVTLLPDIFVLPAQAPRVYGKASPVMFNRSKGFDLARDVTLII